MPDQAYATDVAAKRAELEARGFREIQEIGGFRVGVRVRNRGEQYVEALRHGTAEVVAVLEKDPSSWARTYGRRDVEVIVVRDKPLFEDWSPVGVWADYSCSLVLDVVGLSRG